jgi:FkbM family methyltransferase
MSSYAGFTIREGSQAQQDMDVIEEVYVSDCYAVKSLCWEVENPLVIDVGAHIGTFARRVAVQIPAALRPPGAEILCIEACAENIGLLARNAPFSSRIVRAACYYTDEPLALLNSVFEGGKATGGSIVKRLSEMEAEEPDPAEYWKDTRPLAALTLEDISQGRFIDLLKLDVEGAEINILTGADIARIGTIVGEFHEGERWGPFIRERFAGWRYSVLDSHEQAGRFRLENPVRCSVYVPS